jgi:hypothetical protein
LSISKKKIFDNKFEVTVNKGVTTKHTVILFDKFYESLTNKKISKIKLLEYSFNFLLKKESNTSILSFFELEIISKYFPEYEHEIKKNLK